MINKNTQLLQPSIRSRYRRQTFELMPASLLPYRKTWQPLMYTLPKNSYLIVTKLEQRADNIPMLRLVNSLRRQGQFVYLLSIDI